MQSHSFIRPNKGSVHSDAHGSVDLALLPEIFGKLDDLFARADVPPDGRVQLPCRQTVPCVVVLLFLLERGYSIALHGADTDAQTDVDDRLGYCPVRLDILDLAADTNLLEPGQYVRFRKRGGSIPRGPHATIDVLTSGSSAQPKIVRHDRDKLIGNVTAFGARIRLTRADRVAIPVPIYHMFGLGAALLPAMAAGASVDMHLNSNFLNFQEHERHFQPTATFLTPAYCDQLTRLRRTAYRYDLVVLAGDLVTAETFDKSEQLLGTTVKLYGSSELGAAAAGERTEPASVRGACIGRPLDRVKLQLSFDKPTPSEQASGALLVQHDHSFVGYLSADGTLIEKDQRLTATPYQTGDNARLDADGRLIILGRNDRQVKRDGLFVSLDGLQAKLSQWPEIEAIAVVQSGWSKRGVGLLALCVLKEGQTLEPDQFRARCISKLGRAATPEKITFSDALPMLPNGKVDLNALRVSHADI